MPRTLPTSLSPHVCILPSLDLTQLLSDSSLPPLPYILQSFSPLPQVTTRTTALTSVPHSSFALRFSELADIEAGTREDQAERAARTIDWIAERIGQKCKKWVDDMETSGDKESPKTPWWDEMRRCAEGDHIPSREETWNHPVAIILAISTNSPNPLQAITALHSRPIGLPSWVDPNYLKYTLIVHPEHSVLSDEEAGALFNAVKKQFGLHSYLLPLSLPKPPPQPVPVPALMPRLPPLHLTESPETSIAPLTPFLAANRIPEVNSPNMINTLRMCDQDIQQTARFTREFLVMSVIPWMEKCVVDWNENFTSTRRLPSRLFTSTRRLFGSPSPSPAPTPTHSMSSSMSALPPRANTFNGTLNGHSPPPQQRRLAEFATVLGDIKLAITVWEALRKDNKGGSDILPLLLSPSPALQLHAMNALASVNILSPDPPAYAIIHALQYAVRWEIGIGLPDFLDPALEGDRWFLWAAGNSEEVPSGLLLGQAALLSLKRKYLRRAAFLYFCAAKKLEKSGIKPLTMYFLKRAHSLMETRIPKELSPSFWDSEGKSPTKPEIFDNIMSGIEHPLGRLLYTTGDVSLAIHFFLDLLHDAIARPPPKLLLIDNMPAEVGIIRVPDRALLEDFRVAYEHYQKNAKDFDGQQDLKLPFSFCSPQQSRLRLPRDVVQGDSPEWESRETAWSAFWKTQSANTFTLEKACNVSVNELFYVDLVLRNPLDAEITLSNLTIVVQEIRPDASSSKSFVEVETVETVSLGAKESRTIPISLKCTRPVSLQVTHASYTFLSMLPSTETLAIRGKRLQQTKAQRLTPTYGPDILMSVNVAEANHKLLTNFMDDQRFVLAQGETKTLRLLFDNTGTTTVDDIWVVVGADDELWIGDDGVQDWNDMMATSNSLGNHTSYKIPLIEPLEQDGSIEMPCVFHVNKSGEQELRLLFVYRESGSDTFHTSRLVKFYEVHPILRMSLAGTSSAKPDDVFCVNAKLENVSTTFLIHISQIIAISPAWECYPLDVTQSSATLLSSQTMCIAIGVRQWPNASDMGALNTHVSRQLGHVLLEEEIEEVQPPSIQLCAKTLYKTEAQCNLSASTRHFIHQGRRVVVSQRTKSCHPHIPPSSHRFIFPLYHPTTIDFYVFWDIPSQKRFGHILISGLLLGAQHALLSSIIDKAENTKTKRNMYAETARERMEILESIRNSEWNNEMNPTELSLYCIKELLHDFATKPCLTPVKFLIRNHSLTHCARFTLHLSNRVSDSSAYFGAAYCGRQTFRDILEPLQSTIVTGMIWLTRPGTYDLRGWHLDTEVLETPGSLVRYRYIQKPPSDSQYLITVRDIIHVDNSYGDSM